MGGDTGKQFSWDFVVLFLNWEKKIEKMLNEQLTLAIAKCTLTGLVQ